MSETAVEAHQLCKSFQDEARGLVRAVINVSFRVERGEVLGILGVNGAGKTTTLRMLATLLSPTSGTASIDGHDVRTDSRAARRSLGYLSSSTALYPRLTARETLSFFARMNGYPEEGVGDRVEEVISMMSIGSYADTRTEKLSTGMRQKVSIGRAIVHDPPVLVFDEPAAGLDVLNAHEMLSTIDSLRRGGHAIVFSTHIMAEAERICDRIAVIHAGEILAGGTVEELKLRTGEATLEDAFVKLVEGRGD